jgi:hypothetical protein
MKASRRDKAYSNIISICGSIVLCDLALLWRAGGSEITWTHFFQLLPASCIGGLFIWSLAKVKGQLRSALWGGPNTNARHEENIKPQGNIKACPYCGAEYAKEMAVCPIDHNVLILK